MGLLSGLLAFPVTGSLSGLTLLAEKLVDLAMREEFDPEAIRRRLVALEQRLERGEIGEAEFEAEEALLLERLRTPAPGAAP